MSEPFYMPLSDLQKNAPETIARLRESHRPVYLTEDDRSTAVLLDVETYESLSLMRSRIDVLAGIARGERDFADGKVVSHGDVIRGAAKWRIEK